MNEPSPPNHAFKLVFQESGGVQLTTVSLPKYPTPTHSVPHGNELSFLCGETGVRFWTKKPSRA